MKSRPDIFPLYSIGTLYIPELEPVWKIDCLLSLKDNFKGFTALHAPAISGQADLAKLLCKYGADVNIKNEYGMLF